MKLGDRVEFGGDEDFFRKAGYPEIKIKHGDRATIVGGRSGSWRVEWDNKEWKAWNKRGGKNQQEIRWENSDLKKARRGAGGEEKKQKKGVGEGKMIFALALRWS
mgnify:CR=1 FL=1